MSCGEEDVNTEQEVRSTSKPAFNQPSVYIGVYPRS